MYKKQKQELGQSLIDFIQQEYSILDFIEVCGNDVEFEMDEENKKETFDIKIDKWNVVITTWYKNRGGDDEFPNSPTWDVNNQDVEFDGDGENFREWIKINWKDLRFYSSMGIWKEVYDGYEKNKKKEMDKDYYECN